VEFSVMAESDSSPLRQSKPLAARLRRAGTFVHHAHKRAVEHIRRHLCAFGRACTGLWPLKPAAHLAHLSQISERNANQLITGERKVTARALLAVDQAMVESE
jgi:hypothetical protein